MKNDGRETSYRQSLMAHVRFFGYEDPAEAEDDGATWPPVPRWIDDATLAQAAEYLTGMNDWLRERYPYPAAEVIVALAWDPSGHDEARCGACKEWSRFERKKDGGAAASHEALIGSPGWAHVMALRDARGVPRGPFGTPDKRGVSSPR